MECLTKNRKAACLSRFIDGTKRRDEARVSYEIAGPFVGGTRLGKERRKFIHVKPDAGTRETGTDGRRENVARARSVGF